MEMDLNLIKYTLLYWFGFIYFDINPNRQDKLKVCDWLKDIATLDFSTPSLNPRLFNHEFFNHGVEKFMVEKSGVEKFMVQKSGVEKSGVEAWG